MSFYKVLTPYYDQIFPTNEKAFQFLSSTFPKGGNLLDIGAGTGNIAISLSTMGFKVTAAEPEEMMAEQIRKKAEGNSDLLVVSTKTMQQINEFTDTFDGIYCIGNTLAHLNNVEEIGEFFNQSYKKLNQGGILVLQIVNFDRVLGKQDFSFPVVKKETFEFARHYDLADEKVLFTTTLIVECVSQSNTISLFPVTSKQLLPILENYGFKDIEAYGNFENGAYSIDSPALVVVAKK